jgi:hypothetical protein
MEEENTSSEHMDIADDTLSRRRFLDGESKGDEQLTGGGREGKGH